MLGSDFRWRTPSDRKRRLRRPVVIASYECTPDAIASVAILYPPPESRYLPFHPSEPTREGWATA